MTRALTASLLVLMGLLGSTAQAQKSITLNPNETKFLENKTLWTVKANCIITSNAKSQSKIKISVLKNKGTVNGKNLSSGGAVTVAVLNNSTIQVSAESGTEINLMNLSSGELKAVCS